MALVLAGLLVILFLILIGVLCFVFWLLMLIDSITRKFKDSSDKIIWVLVTILVGIIGALIYYFVVYNKDPKKSMKWFWWTLLVLIILVILSVILFVLVSSPAEFGQLKGIG
jgi:prolipoprotein diacylglyceryltransferase